MEQLIIFLLLVVGSIISSIIQNKKKKAEEQQQRELEELTRRPRGQVQSSPSGTPPRSPQTPQASWPRTAADWQEQLRRMLEGEPAPPVIIKPVLLSPEPTPQRPPVMSAPRKQPELRDVSKGDLVVKRPVQISAASHEAAANLHSAVEERMRVIGEQRVKHTSTPTEQARPRAHSAFVQRLKRNPRAMREAFVASIIFAPPKGLEQDATQLIG